MGPRLSLLLWVTVWSLVVPRDAAAVGALLVGEDPARLVQVRFAVALSSAQTTRWASLRVERFPGRLAWILPLRPGARVEETTDAWFEALDIATAPRVVEPSCDTDAGVARTRNESSSTHEPSAPAIEIRALDGVTSVRAFAAEWALGFPAELETRVADLEARGFRFAALVYGASPNRTLTRTVRVTDDSFPVVPLFLTSGEARPIQVTTFSVGASRTRLGKGVETAIDERILSSYDAGADVYANALLSELLRHRGASWVVEAADHAFLFDGFAGPLGAGRSEPLVGPYFERALRYGDVTDDLSLALAGLDPSTVWITRAAGIVPAREFGDDLAVTLVANETKSPFVVIARNARCATSSDAGFGVPDLNPMADAGVSPPASPRADAGPMVVPPPITSPPITSSPITSPPITSPPGTTGGRPVGSTTDSNEAYVAGSCACSPGEESGGASSDDSCSHSESSTASGADEADESGCAGSADESSDDGAGCDGSDPGYDDDADDGCDGGSSDESDDGCDSSDSSSSAETKCTVSRKPRRTRSRTSAVVVALAAVVLPIRRLTRPRGRGASVKI